MKRLLTILGLTFSIACFGQGDSLKLKVYSDFINADLFSYDSVFSTTTDLLFVTTVDKFEPTIDINYLNDFINGTINKNELFKSSFSGQDPANYFDMPPTFGLGRILNQDKELGDLLIKLFQADKAAYSSIKQLRTNYEIKFIRDPKPYFKMGWDKFHEKYDNCYGIVRLSNIMFNDKNDRAIMYVENFKGGLDASGDIIIMRKLNQTWTIELQINQWIS
jgi:hypothetical protein